jgi:DNA repair protein RadD
MLALRDYQDSSLNGLREGFQQGHRVQMLYLPTGGGKTEIAISMLQKAADNGNRCAMIMDRRVLVDQTSERLDKYDIDHGVLMAGHWRYKTHKSIQICSAQTLEKQGSMPDLKLMIIDEAHTTRKSIAEFIKNNQKVKVVGLSASPFTKGLGAIYSNVVSRSTTKELVDSGMLAPLRVFIAKEIDMTGAKKTAGEWSTAEATERGIKITGDIVAEWKKKTLEIFGEPKKTIVFCAGIAHGQDLVEKFREAGFNFVSISYKDDDEFKAETIRNFSKSDSNIHGLIATDILTKGFDQADVMIGISARPFTKSFSSHVQQLGRIMRPHVDKSAAIWLDHSGNYLRFKEQWDELYSSGVSELDEIGEKAKKEPTQKEKEESKCPECGELWQTSSDTCTHCGHIRKRINQVIDVPGQLEEILSGKAHIADNAFQFYQMCCKSARDESKPEKQEGRAYHLFLEIMGTKPKWNFATTPSHDISRPFAGKIKQQKIAYYAAMKKKKAAA